MDKEKIDLEAFPTSESALRMLGYVSQGFYDKSYVGKWLYQVMGLEYDEARKLVEELPHQMFPETATWGLMYHEMKWQLPVRNSLPYQERRRLIYQKRDYRAPMSPFHMETYLQDLTGFEVHICDINDPGEYGFMAPHPNVFKAYFLGEETLDSRLVRETLNRLKQSHTIYTVNDRIEIVIDCRNMERFVLRTVRFRMGIPFWGCYVFDGSWNLDGTVLLCQKRRYGLGLGLRQGAWKIFTSFRAAILSVAIHISICGEAAHSFHMKQKIIMNFFEIHRQKAALRLHCAAGSIDEQFKNLEVITKTQDYWLFDGTVKLDGEKYFDSIYKKEEIT